MNDDAWDQVPAKLADALADVFHATDGSIVNRWVVLADVMDTEGERALVMQASPDMMAWDTLGMLEFARQAEQAGHGDDDT